jgi:hypothetical protein
MHMKLRTFIAASLSALLVFSLTACGGGGGGGTASGTEPNSTTTPGAFGPAGSAEGTWEGPYAGSSYTRMVVLNTSETFGLYESSGWLTGILYGQLSGNGSVKGVLKDFSLNTLKAENVAVSGSSVADERGCGFLRHAVEYGPVRRGTWHLDPAARARVLGEVTKVPLYLAAGFIAEWP